MSRLVIVFVACSTLGCSSARGDEPPATADSNQRSQIAELGPFRVGMAVDEMKSACESANATFRSPNRHRLTRGCRDGSLFAGEAPVSRFVLRLDKQLRLAKIEAYTVEKHFSSLREAVRRHQGSVDRTAETGVIRGWVQ